MIFRRKKLRHELILVIRSDSVSAGVVSYPPHEKPILHVYVTDTVAPVKELTALPASMRAALARILGRLTMFTTLRLDKVHVIFSAPWYRAVSHTEKESFRKPRVIREDDVRVLLKKSRDARKGAFSSYYPDLLEERLTSIRVDGYNLQNPYGKRAHMLEARTYASASSLGIREMVEQEVGRALGAQEIEFASLAYASFSVFTYFFKHHSSFTLIDVAGEGTDIIVIRDSSIEEVASSALGPTNLARQRSARTGEPLEHARLVFDSSYESKISIEKGKEVEKKEPDTNQEIYDWRSSLASIFSSHAAFLPRQIYILAEQDVRISAAMHLKEVLSESMGTVELFTLKEKDFEPFVEVENNHHPDVFVLLSTLFHVSANQTDKSV